MRPQGCTAPPFSAAALARRVPEATFLRHTAAVVRSKEQALAASIQGEADARVHAAERRFEEERRRSAAAAAAVATSAAARDAAAASALAASASALRLHAAEKILTLHCPTCDQVFAEELDGNLGVNRCFALACARCDARFCAWCLELGGVGRAGDAAAHKHVARCAHNRSPGKDVFGSALNLKACHTERRARLLRALLAAQAPAVRAPLLAAMAQDLRGHGMRAQDFAER